MNRRPKIILSTTLLSIFIGAVAIIAWRFRDVPSRQAAARQLVYYVDCKSRDQLWTFLDPEEGFLKISDECYYEKAHPLTSFGRKDYFAVDQPLSRFCRTLKAASFEPVSGTYTDNGIKIQSYLQPDKAHPYFEAYKPMYRILYSIPEVRELLLDAEKYSLQDEIPWLDKIRFHRQLTKAWDKASQQWQAFNDASNAGYVFDTIYRMIARYPQFSDDEELLSICKDAEAAINDQQTLDYSGATIRLERFASQKQLNLNSLFGYDPLYASNVDVYLDPVYGLLLSGTYTSRPIPPQNE